MIRQVPAQLLHIVEVIGVQAAAPAAEPLDERVAHELRVVRYLEPSIRNNRCKETIAA